jgi:hypothetical protein
MTFDQHRSIEDGMRNTRALGKTDWELATEASRR